MQNVSGTMARKQSNGWGTGTSFDLIFFPPYPIHQETFQIHFHFHGRTRAWQFSHRLYCFFLHWAPSLTWALATFSYLIFPFLRFSPYTVFSTQQAENVLKTSSQMCLFSAHTLHQLLISHTEKSKVHMHWPSIALYNLVPQADHPTLCLFLVHPVSATLGALLIPEDARPHPTWGLYSNCSALWYPSHLATFG